MVTRGAGYLISARQCFRIRLLTKYRQLYEWFTAFGVGFFLWGLADFGIIWNGIVNGPLNRDQYPSKSLWYAVWFQLLETAAVWLVTLILLNGGTPGTIRASIFWTLTKLKIMRSDSNFNRSIHEEHTTIP